MSDINPITPLFINSCSRWSAACWISRTGGSSGGGSTTWVANDVVYIPIHIPWPYRVNRVFWVNGSTAAGNADFGIYSWGGVRIFSTGSTGISGAGVPQYTTVGTPFLLDPGDYYFGYWNSGTTNRSYGISAPGTAAGALLGLQTQAGQTACPATATFATFSTNVIPLCGITRTQSGY